MLRIWRCDCALCVIGNSFHAANHTIPPPPSYEGYPHCPKDKNRSPFHGEKPQMKQSSGRDVIFHVRP